MHEAVIDKLMYEALNDLNFIFKHYIELMIKHGLSTKEIIEVLKSMGYGWC